jgi:hypothetical protein
VGGDEEMGEDVKDETIWDGLISAFIRHRDLKQGEWDYLGTGNYRRRRHGVE